MNINNNPFDDDKPISPQLAESLRKSMLNDSKRKSLLHWSEDKYKLMIRISKSKITEKEYPDIVMMARELVLKYMGEKMGVSSGKLPVGYKKDLNGLIIDGITYRESMKLKDEIRKFKELKKSNE